MIKGEFLSPGEIQRRATLRNIGDEQKHTPGPWTRSENAYGAVFVHGGETRKTPVGTEYQELIAGGNSHNTLTLANARLIAAAPDLLEVVKAFVAETVDYATLNNLGDPEQQHNVKWARSVIAKAEGHQ